MTIIEKKAHDGRHVAVCSRKRRGTSHDYYQLEINNGSTASTWEWIWEVAGERAQLYQGCEPFFSEERAEYLVDLCILALEVEPSAVIYEIQEIPRSFQEQAAVDFGYMYT